jgi:hypothetical protein
MKENNTRTIDKELDVDDNDKVVTLRATNNLDKNMFIRE